MIGLYLSAIDPVETALQTGLISELEQVTPNLISEIQRLLAEGRLPSEQLVHTFDLRFFLTRIISCQNHGCMFSQILALEEWACVAGLLYFF
jgi:hypothetical protein